MKLKFSTYHSNQSQAYIIAEVGQNHCGSVESALEHVRRFAEAGADAVKFQMRSNKYLFSPDAYSKTYNSENSFGATYGEHREALELTIAEMIRVRQTCLDHKVDFIATPFDEPSLDELVKLKPDALKVASFDLGNLPFLKLMAETGLPMVVSVGGGHTKHIEATLNLLQKCEVNLAVLHCVSRYPCPAEYLRLSEISKLRSEYPSYTIGLSDHFNGISSGVVAYMLGARIFEKHVTLNRAARGTDQPFSLEPEGFRKFARDIRRTPKMLNSEIESDVGKEPVFKKLGKSLVVTRDLAPGDIISIGDLSGRIFNEPILPVRESYRVVGRAATRPLKSGQPITLDDLE